MFMFDVGAPLVVLSRLKIVESAHGAALDVTGGTLAIDGCYVTANPLSTLRMTAGRVDVRDSLFEANGRRSSTASGRRLSAPMSHGAAAALKLNTAVS